MKVSLSNISVRNMKTKETLKKFISFLSELCFRWWFGEDYNFMPDEITHIHIEREDRNRVWMRLVMPDKNNPRNELYKDIRFVGDIFGRVRVETLDWSVEEVFPEIKKFRKSARKNKLSQKK